MERIHNKLFKNYFLEKHLNPTGMKLDNFYDYLNSIEKFRQKSFSNGLENKESKLIGSVVFDIHTELVVNMNSFSYKFVDLLNGLIASINAESYSGALAISRSLLEHFSMISLKYNRYLTFLEKKDYEKLAKELAYWGVDYKINSILSDEAGKRTHVYDALRHFSKYISEKNDVKFSEKEILGEYDEFSEMTHPAATSLLMYSSDATEHTLDEDGSIGIGQKYKFSQNSKRIQERVFNLLSWPMLFTTIHLPDDIYPNLLVKVIQKFSEDRGDIVNYFKNNPNLAKELIEKIVNREELEKYYKTTRSKYN